MKQILFVLATCLSIHSKANTADPTGFKAGNDRSVQRISGQLWVTCNNGQQSAQRFATCRAEIMFPHEFDYFVGPKVPNANRLVIKARTLDGKHVETKTEKYLGDKGQSLRRINLWVRTLTQSPLLDIGPHIVEYTLLKDQTVLTKGQFEVGVSVRSPKSCAYSKSYYSNNMSDCNHPELLCPRYFSDMNYCQ